LIEFLNAKIGILTRLASAHLYQNKNIALLWTPIEALTKEIMFGQTHTHLLTHIQFPIQLAAARTIHRSQDLSLNR